MIAVELFYSQSTEKFSSRELLLHELDKHGGVYDCQRSRDLMMYFLSVFSFTLPETMEILADCIWHPQLTPEEVIEPPSDGYLNGHCSLYSRHGHLYKRDTFCCPVDYLSGFNP